MDRATRGSLHGLRHVSVMLVSFVVVAVIASCGEDDFGRRSYLQTPQVAKCSKGIVVDGAFTDFERGCEEWKGVSVAGLYGKFYFEYRDDTLFVLNDWSLRDDAPAEPDMYNLFQFVCGGVQWEVRVFGNSTIEVWRDGEVYNQAQQGATGFRASPNNAVPHTIFEFSLRMPGEVTGCLMKAADPGGGTGATPEDVLVTEPTMFAFDIKSNISVTTGFWPTLVAALPRNGLVGDEVTFTGANLGSSGELLFGGAKASIVSWDDETIVAIVPSTSGPVSVYAHTEAGTSNALLFQVSCVPACEDKVCGADGCGGVCGYCSASHACEDGSCVCQPSCSGKQCGDDGCGGSCGNCGQNQMCSGGLCVCAPSCSGKQCGNDGCGGSCGTCPPKTHCGGNDQCVPDLE